MAEGGESFRFRWPDKYLEIEIDEDGEFFLVTKRDGEPCNALDMDEVEESLF